MDFLEGFLIGPVWSDTEYETRRHVGLYWFAGWLFLAFFAYSILYPERLPTWLDMPGFIPYIGFFALAAATPFACRYYYQLNIVFKLLILMLLAVKFLLGFVAFWQILQVRIQIDTTTAPQDILEYINRTIASSTEYFSGLGEGLGLVVGIIAGGFLIVAVFAGSLLLMTAAPAIYIAVMQLIQRGIDHLARYTLLRD